MDLDTRLDILESTISSIVNSNKFITQEQLEAARVSIFDTLRAIKADLDTQLQQLYIIEEQLNQYTNTEN